MTCVTGETKKKLTNAVLEAAETGNANLEYEYMPSKLKEPYISRKRAVGYALYELYGIKRDDYPARKAAMLRNFEFLEPSWLFSDGSRTFIWILARRGMFMQNVMILLEVRA